MLFKHHQLLGIRSGEITLAFRRWKKLAVTKGSTMKTGLGVIRVDSVEKIRERDITIEEAADAGFESLDQLLKGLRKEGSIYKIELSYQSEDPRIELREKTSISDDEFQKLKTKLDRLDKTRGP